MHVHVDSGDGELKVWLEPGIEVVQTHRVPEREVARILRNLERRHAEIRERWQDHWRR